MIAKWGAINLHKPTSYHPYVYGQQQDSEPLIMVGSIAKAHVDVMMRDCALVGDQRRRHLAAFTGP